jgi:hypothetical protein
VGPFDGERFHAAQRSEQGEGPEHVGSKIPSVFHQDTVNTSVGVYDAE